jgi:CheY-like chemotaxis protein
MDILKTSLVDLIVSDVHLGESSGFDFLRQVHREQRLRHIPFLFVSSDGKLASKINGLRLGAVDYMVKPLQLQELVVRIGNIIKRIESERAALAKRNYSLAGELAAIDLADLVNLLQHGRRTGTLSLITPRTGGRILFVDGTIRDITFGNLAGPDAFYGLMDEPNGQFEFMPHAVAKAEAMQHPAMNATALLMEGARRLDQVRMGGGAGAAVAKTATAAAQLPGVDVLPPEGAPPTPEIVSECRKLVLDPFALGQLQLLSDAELAEWTATTAASARFFAILVTEVTHGVSELSGLASPLSETGILRGLSREAVAMALSFFTRAETQIDVLLLDPDTAHARLDHIKLRPACVIVAPPKGDWLEFSISSRIGGPELLARLRPASLLAVGNEKVETMLEATAQQSGLSVKVQRLGGDADDVPELRQCIAKALDLWLSAKNR